MRWQEYVSSVSDFRKTSSHFGLVRELHLKDVRKDDFGESSQIWLTFFDLFCTDFLFAQQIRHNAARLSWIDILFALSPGSDIILLHHSFHPILPHMQQFTQLPMTHGIIFFMPSFNSHCHLFIFFGLFPLEIQ